MKLLLFIFGKVERYYPKWSEFALLELKSVKFKKKKFQPWFESSLQIQKLWPQRLIIAPADDLDTLILPDATDNVILKEALAGGCSAIITYNTKDFHSSKLKKLGLTAIHPDKFLLQMLTEEREHDSILREFIQEENLSPGFLSVYLDKIALPRYAKALKRRGF